MIYKIFLSAEWAQLQADGQTKGAPIDLSDGYVHFSTKDQAGETAAKYFAGIDGLKLLAVDDAKLGDDLKWEVSRGGDLFPHLYRELRLTDVVAEYDLPFEDGAHIFPEGLT